MIAGMITLVFLASPPATGDVLMVGDSLTGIGTYPDLVAAEVSSSHTLIGRKTTDASTHHEGTGGWDFEQYVTDPTSPFLDASAILDVPAYFATYGTPDIVVIGLGINQIYGSADATAAETAAATEIYYGEILVDAIRAAAPGVHIVITTPPPAADDDTLWSGAPHPKATWETYRQIVKKRWAETWGGCGCDNVYLLPLWVDPVLDYVSDNLHPGYYNQMARRLGRFLRGELH